MVKILIKDAGIFLILASQTVDKPIFIQSQGVWGVRLPKIK